MTTRIWHRRQGGTAPLRTAIVTFGAVASVLATVAPAAVASPVATDDSSYAALGRVFPDPLAGCQLTATEPCSPNAQGNVPAAQFIQIEEFLDALAYMNSKPEWSPYMEVLVLDGALGSNAAGEGPADAALDAGDSPGDAMFPGNDLPLEFDPKPAYRSAGLATSGVGRQKSDLITIRVTDESVPDADKKRYALSLSIHGIERAGVEGGTRAAEDLITAFTSGRSDQPVVPESAAADAPTFAEVLRESIIYFTYPNPDGWRRGSVTEGGIFFQRYNGNGMDVNRDWPDIGFSFRPYSGLSEPESRALSGLFTGVESETGSEFAAGDDLHGQPLADALSFTLLPHGRHDFAKNERIRETAIAIHRASEAALLWSPIVQPNDAPQDEGIASCTPDTPVGTPCSQIYGQTWGTVYDTINYTTTGALGDWFDSTVGLGADGIDNEMSFSHLDKNIAFDPHTEQLHVDGNKALIYAHLTTMLGEPAAASFDAPGTKGYVPNKRLVREEKEFQGDVPPNTVAQDDVDGQLGTMDQNGEVIFPFTVERTAPTASVPGIYSGGIRVDVRALNAQGVGSGIAHLEIECKGCDEHPGVPEDDEWVSVAEDFNQSPAYAQAGVTASLNRPQAFTNSGDAVEWRAVLSGDAVGVPTPSPSPIASMDIDYTSEPASVDGATGGDDPPKLAGYDIANTDFFDDLDPFIPGTSGDFDSVDPRAVISGQRSLAGLDSLVLADDALPGYTGTYGPSQVPTGPPTADFTFDGMVSVPGASSGIPGTFEEFPFTIGPDDANGSLTVRIEWDLAANDFDMFLERVEENDDRTVIASSTQTQGESDFEQIEVANPSAGDYVIRVDNFAAADPRFAGTATFEPPAPGPPEPVATGDYSVAEKDVWIAKLLDWVEDGGNLVLTDGALRALADLTSITPAAIRRQTVYAGQTAFATAEDEPTLDDPLADDVDQPGSRFGSGMRRQTFEPTPLGFSIQDDGGSNQSNARQFDVSRTAWEAAGGTTAGTSVNDGAGDASALFNRVTLGELELGDGQIRIAGSLLPQPSEAFDHTLGLEPYAATYTGYILIRNLLEVAGRAPGPGPGPGPGPAADDPDGGSPSGRRTCLGETVTVFGSGDRDRLRGTRGDDVIRARRGDDSVRARGGDDLVCSGPGDDVVRTGAGNDRVRGGPGHDTCRGGPGRDKLSSCP